MRLCVMKELLFVSNSLAYGNQISSTRTSMVSHARSQKENHRLARRKKSRQEDHQLQTARLAVQPAALLGRAVSDCLEKRRRTANLYHEALPESALPLLPPTLEDYKPTADGEPPLARAKDWLNLPDGSIRETNTMPQWAGSCWYYLRYLDAKNASRFRRQGSGKLLDGRRVT